MKRITPLALALGLSLTAAAQDITYALPSTVFTVKVTVLQEQFYAGPYAPYAKQFLNLDVAQEDASACSVIEAELLTRTEADPKALYTTEAENASLLALGAQGLVALQSKAETVPWRFQPPVQARFNASITSPERDETRITYKTIQTAEGELQVPVEHKARQAKSLEDKAAEAAEMILTLRKDRLNIISGNTDASYSGEAMGAALKELDRLEAEYLALFQGCCVRSELQAAFDVVPDPSQVHHRYLAFRLTENGPVPDGVKGVPYYIELEPEEMAFPAEPDKKSKAKENALRYRIPAVCKVRFTRDGVRLLETRQPVYQLGKETLYSTYK